jgi:hypothetical protein
MGITHNYLPSNIYFVHSWLGFQKKGKKDFGTFLGHFFTNEI